MTPQMIQTLMGALGSVGFAVLFNVRGYRLILLFLGGALDWAVYLICEGQGCGPFLSVFLATATAAFLSEVLARLVRAPVLILLVPMLVPLIPGSALYHTMDALIREEQEAFLRYGSTAITWAGAIALGIICMTALSHLIFGIVEYCRKRFSVSEK